jgi:hypothetical protein
MALVTFPQFPGWVRAGNHDRLALTLKPRATALQSSTHPARSTQVWLHLLAPAARELFRTRHFGLVSRASRPVGPGAKAPPAKESDNRAFESSLNEGHLFGGRAFSDSLGLEDQKEGMAPCAEKRKASFRNR